MEAWEQLWRRIREVFTDEELNNLIIYEQEQERLRQQEEERRRPELHIPIEPPPLPIQEEEDKANEDPQRGVIILVI